jgi:hypothetical protein
MSLPFWTQEVLRLFVLLVGFSRDKAAICLGEAFLRGLLSVSVEMRDVTQVVLGVPVFVLWNQLCHWRHLVVIGRSLLLLLGEEFLRFRME